MLKVFLNKTKNKKKNSFVIGRKGTGMVRLYIKPIASENQISKEDMEFHINGNLYICKVLRLGKN